MIIQQRLQVARQITIDNVDVAVAPEPVATEIILKDRAVGGFEIADLVRRIELHLYAEPARGKITELGQRKWVQLDVVAHGDGKVSIREEQDVDIGLMADRFKEISRKVREFPKVWHHQGNSGHGDNLKAPPPNSDS